MILRLLFILTIFVAGLPGFAQQYLFTEANVTLPQIAYSACAWGDYDHDGDLDLALSGAEGNSPLTRIFRNDNGSYTDIQAGLLPLHFGSIEWGDYDGDGDLDLLVTGIESNGTPHTLIYRNSDGTFSNSGISFPGIMDGQAVWGDLNNDGKPDILLTGGGLTKIYQNNGNEQFIEIAASLPLLDASMCSFNDYNHDGQTDLMVCGNTGGGMVTKLFRNIHGNFSEVAITPEPFYGLYGGQVKWSDLDCDGDQDMVVAGTDLYVDGYCLVYRNEGSDQFTRFDITGAGLLNPTFDLCDYDADGLTDIMLIGTTPGCGGPSVTLLIKNMGDFNFSLVSSLLPGFKLGSVNWGDFNNDGFSDLIFTGLDIFEAPKTAVFLNNLGNPATYQSNTAPGKPTNLVAAMEGSRLVFSWERAADGQTPPQAITYNLAIGTSPDAFDILSPLASLVNGSRSIPASGNVGSDTSWSISGLESGTYYCSVQAIDNGFMPGLFSEPVPFYYSPVGIKNQIPADLTVSPNPCQDFIRIYESPDQKKHYGIRVIDDNGKTVFSGANPGQLDTTHWPAGFYLVKKESSPGSVPVTFIKR